MSVTEIDTKRTTQEKLQRALSSKEFIVAYTREDGSIGTLCTTNLPNTSFMLRVLEFLYLTAPIAESSTDLED